jgi:hypothetical protein
VLARYNSVNATAQNVASTPFQSYSSDPNAFVAPLNATQQSGIANTNQYAGTAQPYYQAAAGLTALGAGQANPTALDGNAIGQYMSPYLSNVAQTTSALQNQQNQQALQGGLGDAIRNNAFGGDRAGIAAANTQQQLSLSNASTLSNLFNTGYNNALSTAQQQQGVGLGAQQQNLARLTGAGSQLANIGAGAQTAGLAGAQAQLTAGQTQQQTQQAGQTALYNQFLQQQSYPFQTAQFLANIAEGTGSLSGSTTTSTQTSPFFSDERLKEDIEPIGKTFDGSNIVKFRYKGQNQKHIGLIAQDVEKRHPHAVGLAGGYKTVDYDAATKDAADMGRGLGRKAYAYGGYGSNQVDNSNALMEQMYGLAPWGNAGPGGATGEVPYAGKGRGVVPASKLPVGQLMIAHSQNQNNGTPVQQANQALQVANGLGKMGRNGYDTLQSWQQQQAQGTPPVNSNDVPASNGVGSHLSAGGQVPAIGAPPPAGLAGYRHRDMGGQLQDETDEPYVAGTGQHGLSIPDDRNHRALATASNPSGQQQSGLGALGQDVGLANGLYTAGSNAAPYLAAMFAALARGGSARLHRDAGGITNENYDGTPEAMDDAINSNIARGLPSNNYAPNEGSKTPAPAPGLYARQKAEDTPVDPMLSSTPEPDTSTSESFGRRLREIFTNPKRLAESDQTGRGIPEGYASPAAEQTDPNSPPAAGLAGRTTPPADQQERKGLAALASQSPDTGDKTGKDASAPKSGLGAAETPPAAFGSAASEPSATESARALLPDPATQNGGIGKWMKDNQHLWVPLLSGLGAMASSNSRYLGSAVLQGLGAGAASYQNVENNEADRAHSAASTMNTDELTRAQKIENAKKFLLTNKEGMPAGVLTPGGAKSLDEMGPGERAGIPGSDVTSSGVPGQPGVAAPGVGAPAPGAAPPPKHANIPGVNIDATTIAAAQEAKHSSFRPMTSNDDIVTTKEYRGRVDAGLAQATADSQPINEMVSTTAHALASGQTGALGNTRAEIGKYLNLLAKEAGAGDNYFSDAAGGREIMDKIATLRAGANAGIAGQHALEALQQFRNANPDIDHDPKANASIAALAMVQRQMMIDQAKHANAFQNLSGGNLRGAEADFSRNNGRYRNETNTLFAIMAENPDYMEKLLSGQMTQAQIEKYFNGIAPGLKDMSRYFPARAQ